MVNNAFGSTQIKPAVIGKKEVCLTGCNFFPPSHNRWVGVQKKEPSFAKATKGKTRVRVEDPGLLSSVRVGANHTFFLWSCSNGSPASPLLTSGFRFSPPLPIFNHAYLLRSASSIGYIQNFKNNILPVSL